MFVHVLCSGGNVENTNEPVLIFFKKVQQQQHSVKLLRLKV